MRFKDKRELMSAEDIEKISGENFMRVFAATAG